ncbi:hypothetical protein ACET54_15085 [Aeromonas veronii]|nr:hypothetical protein [Aeromonas veronii]
MANEVEEKRKNDIELLKVKVDIWKQVINTQQHFNDLEMKVRNFAILILSAFIGAIGVSFKSGFSLDIMGHSTSIATILSLGAAIIWMLFFFVDVYWYHPLLIGAVKQGMKIERELEHELPNIIGLTKTIGDESPVKIKFWKWNAHLHSKEKANIYYIGVFVILIVSSVILFFVDTPKNSDAINKQNKSATINCTKQKYNTIECTFNLP